VVYCFSNSEITALGAINGKQKGSAMSSHGFCSSLQEPSRLKKNPNSMVVGKHK
jgi:hypothetical protein